MKIITKSTFVVEDGETVPPETELDIDDAEAKALIAKGLAEVPKKEPSGGKAAGGDKPDNKPKT